MAFYTDYPVYPTTVLTTAEYLTQADDVDWVYDHLVNALRDEVIAIQSELGTLPSGASATVKARLDALGTPSKIQDADADTLWDTEESADKDEIQGKVKGVEFFRGHDDGVVTTAKQSGCRVHRTTSAQTITTALLTKIQYNGEIYDIQNEFDSTTNYRFTAKKAGKYLMTATVYVGTLNDGSELSLFFRKNGADISYARSLQGVAAGPFANGSVIIQLAINDYLEAWVYHNYGSNRDLTPAEAQNNMSIQKLS